MAQNFVTKTRFLESAHSENFVILASTVLLWLTQTHRQIDA